MLMRHAGMLATDKNNLLLNNNNHVARQRRMLVPDNELLILIKEVFLACKRDCLGHGKGCLPQIQQAFHQTRGHPHATQ